jgi:hypothetical protein
MSKFDELIKACEKLKEAGQNYRFISEEFADRLQDGFASYLETDKQNVRLFPPSENYDPKATRWFLPSDALELEKEDGFWLMGLALHLPPVRTVYMFKLKFKYINDKFIVKDKDKDKEFTVGSGTEDELRPFFDHLFEIVRYRYEQGFQDFLHEKGQRNSIGFVSDLLLKS